MSDVQDKPSISRQSPTLIQIRLGRSVELFCAIPTYKARPFVSATWTFQKSPVQLKLTDTIIGKNEDKFILKVAGDKASNGTYQCRLRNHFGVATSKPIDVIVTCKLLIKKCLLASRLNQLAF